MVAPGGAQRNPGIISDKMIEARERATETFDANGTC